MGEKWEFRANKEDEIAGFKMLEPGRYKLGILDKQDGTTSTGKPMVTLTLQAIEGPTPEANMFHRVTLIPQGEPGHGFLLHFLHAVGLPYDGDVSFDTDEFVGREFTADVTQEEYSDKEGRDRTTNRLSKIYTEEDLVEEGKGAEEEKAVNGKSASAPTPVPAPARAAQKAFVSAVTNSKQNAQAKKPVLTRSVKTRRKF